jgi:hypothetical protein
MFSCKMQKKNYFEILKVKVETLLRGEGGTRQNL